MKKLEKVQEPKNYDENNTCERCDQEYCANCVDFETVDFDVVEDINFDRPDLEVTIVNYKDEEVCPWCYNQLIDIAGRK